MQKLGGVESVWEQEPGGDLWSRGSRRRLPSDMASPGLAVGRAPRTPRCRGDPRFLAF